MHNEKVTVEVPKTGDDSNLFLWIALMAVGAAGAGATVFFYLKKKRESGKPAALRK
ncbi:MAG: LPXTG cell wall anchor domain-containing protein [Candidatus Gastranaerophilaceae bacterium]